MSQRISLYFLLLLLLASSCSTKKSIGVISKLQALQSDVMQYNHPSQKPDKIRAISNPSRLTAPHLARKHLSTSPAFHSHTSLSTQLKGGGNNPLKGKPKKASTDDPDPRTTEKLGIIGCAAGIVGVVGLFATTFLPLIFAAAVIAILGGLVGVMRSKEKYKRQGFAKASLVLGLITLIGLAIML